MREILTFIF